MKKIITAMAIVFCFTIMCSGKDASDSLFAGYPFKSASWKSKTTIESPEETVTYEQTVFLKGKKMRTEGKFLNRATNEKENQITIIDKDTIYSINPDKKQGMKYSLNSANNPAKSDTETNRCRETAKKTGSEKIKGVKCSKYEYTCKIAGTVIKITEYRNSKGFSLKTVSKTGKTTTTVETTELKENASIPDSKFVPARDIKFMDMDNMMNGDYKKMMKNAKKFEKKHASEDDEDEDDDGDDSGREMMKDMMKNMMGQ